jgi:hypothetical protein
MPHPSRRCGIARSSTLHASGSMGPCATSCGWLASVSGMFGSASHADTLVQPRLDLSSRVD